MDACGTPEQPIKRFGLTEVYVPADVATADVVFIHGLNGNPHDTWTSEISHNFWPAQLLPCHLQEEKARILVYGYDADIVSFTDGVSSDKIHNHAEHLVAELAANRSVRKARERLIIFVAYSLGGFVLKRALIYSSEICGSYTEYLRSIFVSTYGIIFLGTPHKGMDTMRWRSRLEAVCQVAIPNDVVDHSSYLVDALKSNNQTLQNIDRQFIQLSSHFHLYFFHEGKPTDIGNKKEYIVDEGSASPNIQDVERAVIQQDHLHMCKFESNNTPGFELLAEGIQRYASRAPGTISLRWGLEKADRLAKRRAQAEELYPDIANRSDIVGLSKSTPPAWYPLTGYSKSQIALEYAYRSIKLTGKISVIWVDASSELTFQTGLMAFAEQAGFQNATSTQATMMSQARIWLEKTHNKWLLIIDNADDERIFDKTITISKTAATGIVSEKVSLLSYIPRCANSAIIFTTRNGQAANRLTAVGDVVEVPALDKEGGRRLLTKKLGVLEANLESTAEDLLSLLCYLPLAIVQAAAYIRSRVITITDYISLFEENENDSSKLLNEDFEDTARSMESKNAVLKTWIISFKQIERYHRRSADLLFRISFYSHQRIPSTLLYTGGSKADYITDLGVVKSFSLVSRSDLYGAVDLHRVVQICTRAWLRSISEESKWASEATRVASLSFPEDDVDNWAHCATLLPHALAVLECQISNEARAAQATLQAHVGSYLVSQGKYDEAVSWHRRALATRQSELGGTDYRTLQSSESLGKALWRCGEFEAARTLLCRSLKSCETELGIEHKDTLKTCATLSDVCWDLGLFKATEELNKRALEGRRRVLGDKHRDTLDSESNVAVFQWFHGDYFAALKTAREHLLRVQSSTKDLRPESLRALDLIASLEEALGVFESAQHHFSKLLEGQLSLLGPDHPENAKLMSRLANIYAFQRKFQEAYRYGNDAYELSKRVLGQTHPQTISSLQDLAMIYENDGKFTLAEECLLLCLEYTRKRSGDKSPIFHCVSIQLANLWRVVRRYKEAEQTVRQVLSDLVEQLGARHPNTMQATNSLVLTLRDQCTFEEAERINRELLEDQKETLGPKHPSTLTSASILALVLQDQRQYEEAEQVNRQVLADRKEVLGPKHPSTLTSASNLASVLQDQRQYEEAEQVNRQVLADRKEVLGPKHPDTLDTRVELARIFTIQKKYSESEDFTRQVLKDLEEGLGRDHLTTLRAMNNLGVVYWYLNKYEEAEELTRQALEGEKAFFAGNSPRILNTTANLAAILGSRKDYKAAEDLSRQVLEARKKVLGKQHPDTLTSVDNLAGLLQDQGRYTDTEELYRTSMNNLAEVLSSRGNYEEAEHRSSTSTKRIKNWLQRPLQSAASFLFRPYSTSNRKDQSTRLFTISSVFRQRNEREMGQQLNRDGRRRSRIR
ncbi:hypothetical protein OEA41_010458 [Lepraria neglecta]|uniref:DUF676 domain-containing protein n=1 Tax=Lepraria neglecta TaxID=209136 RepID=A0AAD9YXW8_9LECA|nr:hypothetical protein OEA41_010458 [Lepraria neglecta]